MDRRMMVRLVLTWMIVLGGCVAPVTPQAPAPAAQPEQSAIECPSATQAQPAARVAARESEEPQLGYLPESVLLTGLAGDIVTLASGMEEFGPLGIELSFEGDNPGVPDYGSEQAPWFTVRLAEEGFDNAERVAELFGSPFNDLGQAATLVFARTPVFNMSSENAIDPQHVPVLAVAQIAAASRDLYARGELQLPVLAQLNRTISLPTPGVMADPNGIGAHPCGPLDEADGASTATFWAQWALHSLPGVGVFSGGSDRGCAASDGAETPVRVVVFDTSPVPHSAGQTPGTAGPTLNVPLDPACGPTSLAVATSSYIVPKSPPADISQHGLFAAALAYAGWRNAEIHLARVLDNDGTGDLYTLLQAMMAWRETALTTPAPTIFNLSLGIDPLAVTLSEDEEILLDQLLDLRPNSGPPISYKALDVDANAVDPNAGLPLGPAVALETAIRIISDSGILIVAAAGNDMGGEQFPAAYQTVLGVAAGSGTLSPTGQVVRGCFSSNGDVVAPGGDALTGNGQCDPVNAPKCASTSCPQSVLSVVALDSAATQFGLAFWSGTSFSAPLVSGLAARHIAGNSGVLSSSSSIESFVLAMKSGCTQMSVDQICVANLDNPPLQP